MLKLSENAAAALENLRESEGVPANHGARITGGQQPGGDVVVKLEFVETPPAEDKVAEQAGTEVFVDPEVAGVLSDTVMEVEDRGEGLAFVFVPQ